MKLRIAVNDKKATSKIVSMIVMKKVKIGESVISLWFIIVLFISGIAVGILADNVWRTITLYEELKVSILKSSSGKIAYDTFSASGGTETDIPWTFVQNPEWRIGGVWTVEDGKLKSESTLGNSTVGFPTEVSVHDVVWEVRVRSLLLRTEGPEMLLRAGSYDGTSLEAVFDYYHTARLLRVMIAPGPPGTPHTTYQTVSFDMSPGNWYTLKVTLSGTNLKAYVNDVLKFDISDSNLSLAPPRRLEHLGYYDGEWGYWDDVKIWKSNTIAIANLEQGQKVELIDNAGYLRTSDTVGTGETKAVLDVSILTFPFEGYFKVYANDGVSLLHTSGMYQDIWGGDEYIVAP